MWRISSSTKGRSRCAVLPVAPPAPAPDSHFKRVVRMGSVLSGGFYFGDLVQMYIEHASIKRSASVCLHSASAWARMRQLQVEGQHEQALAVGDATALDAGLLLVLTSLDVRARAYMADP